MRQMYKATARLSMCLRRPFISGVHSDRLIQFMHVFLLHNNVKIKRPGSNKANIRTWEFIWNIASVFVVQNHMNRFLICIDFFIFEKSAKHFFAWSSRIFQRLWCILALPAIKINIRHLHPELTHSSFTVGSFRRMPLLAD